MSIGNRIKKYRESKNYTQAYMADSLGISQNTYSKIETGGIKLTVDRLKKISDILGIPVEDIMANDSQSFVFNNSNIDKFYGYIETVHEDNKELTQATINILQDQIQFQRKEIERLLDIIANQQK